MRHIESIIRSKYSVKLKSTSKSINWRKMELSWQILLFTYLILAFALYGILHWIEVVLGNENEKSNRVHLMWEFEYHTQFINAFSIIKYFSQLILFYINIFAKFAVHQLPFFLHRSLVFISLNVINGITNWINEKDYKH